MKRYITLSFVGTLVASIAAALCFLMGWNFLAIISGIAAMGLSCYWSDETEKPFNTK